MSNNKTEQLAKIHERATAITSHMLAVKDRRYKQAYNEVNMLVHNCAIHRYRTMTIVLNGKHVPFPMPNAHVDGIDRGEYMSDPSLAYLEDKIDSLEQKFSN